MTVVLRTIVPIPTRLLVIGMAHDDGTIDAGQLYAVAAACGQGPEQVRSCLRRMVADGLYRREGSGRSARYHLTERGAAVFGAQFERTRRAFVQDAAGRGWDRYWRLVAFAIPEERRAERDAFRTALVELGGASVQGGLYVSPHPWHKDVRMEAERLGIAESVTVASTDDLDVAGATHPVEIARRLWPVDDLGRRYERLVWTFRPIVARLQEMRERKERVPETVFLPGALQFSVAFAEVFEDDPLLPPELLPHPWPGRTARELVREARRLALAQRETPTGPALFQFFDVAVEAIP